MLKLFADVIPSPRPFWSSIDPSPDAGDIGSIILVAAVSIVVVIIAAVLIVREIRKK